MSYRIDPRLRLTHEVRRIATEELEGALGHLATLGENPDKALHECRKRLKSVRALVRLVRSGDAKFAQAENALCRKASTRLAAQRGAAALVETLDRLAAEYPEEAAGGALGPVREELVARHATLLDQDLRKAAAAASAACRTGLRRLEGIDLPDHPEAAADVLADGVRTTMQRARKSLRRSKERGEPVDFHDLRKAVKAHARHLALLKKVWPSPVKPRIKALDALGQKLGDLNDLFVLRALFHDVERPLGKRTRVPDKLALRSERKLRKKCLAEASELFHDSPKRSAKGVARTVRRGMAKQAPDAAS
ncbi:MAG: CHAD domain-containing protein [Hyphomicrobiales bacterium]|nr:CHAD domain-containing protein [Hyphomicrobiales bacterium]